MHVVNDYSIEEVFSLMAVRRGRATLSDGRQVKLSGTRMRLFYEKGVTCVTCGLAGSFFRLESHADEPPHLNLYARLGDKVVLITKDHVIPKSKGGPEAMENFQVMCSPCNGAKADKV